MIRCFLSSLLAFFLGLLRSRMLAGSRHAAAHVFQRSHIGHLSAAHHLHHLLHLLKLHKHAVHICHAGAAALGDAVLA